MEPVFVDIHIHTSENPDCLNENYDLITLYKNINKVAEGSECLISLTDHNVINKSVYLEAQSVFPHILLGVELHLRNYDVADPYHCHMLFNLEEINEQYIDEINNKLNQLYPKKEVAKSESSIPSLQKVMNCFDEYEFLLLPHGGQNHSTFDDSIPKGVQFDKTLERSIYYNYFDGFTARSDKSLEKTFSYFEKLGIREFINLVTATDNYSPSNYPHCKAGRLAEDFIPTWMLAKPTFEGLRLSLSESSRLKYGNKPDLWAEFIKHVSLENSNIEIDVSLTPGLNVVIGGSSSGKSLFVDSVYKRIVGNFDGSVYLKTPYDVESIVVDNPSGQQPHYIDQGFIGNICNPKDQEHSIDDISILKRIFPSDRDEREKISNGLTELKKQLGILVNSVREIQKLQEELKRIPILSHLIITETIQDNPIKYLLPSLGVIESVSYNKPKFDNQKKTLEEIDAFLLANPLISYDNRLIAKLKQKLKQAYDYSELEISVRQIVEKYQNEIDDDIEKENKEMLSKRKGFENLINCIMQYIRYQKEFNESLEKISMFSIKSSTKERISSGHKLFIDNEFELSKEKFLEVVNSVLKSDCKIGSYELISPEMLFESNFKKQKPKIADYDSFEQYVNSKFNEMNHKKYRIITDNGKDFECLSAGWKTSVILDLILGWGSDNAPLIIDQPEDNLATSYINHGLLKAIKKCKTKKQIILVSHNATIPMLGDAQNIIMCRNNDNKISIKSSPLEGSIENERVVDLVAKTTDGGKAAVKKRVKKYNLKSFRGDYEDNL